MKKLLFTLSLSVLFMGFQACKPNENTGDKNGTAAADTNKSETPPPSSEEYIKKAESMARTTAKFESEEFDFKTIKEGDEVSYRFNFTNTGANDLLITNVKPSCGCTTPSWPKEPLKPGEKGFIDVKFNSAGKVGVVTKTITVTANLEGDINKVLKLKGEVKPKEGAKEEKK